MKRSVRIWSVILCMLLAVACKEDNIIKVVTPVARLRSVAIEASTLVLPPEGADEMPFRVRDPEFEFNYDVTSPDCQVRLRAADGSTPTLFRLLNVIKVDDNGLYKAVVADNGIDPDYVEKVCVMITLHGEGGVESYVPTDFFEVRSEAAGYGVMIKTGLPVLYLDTDGGKKITSKTTFIPGSMRIKGYGGYESQGNMRCSVRGRGNTTWSWPKKPYLVKFDTKQSLLGMPEHKRWVLLANFMDRTLMRNMVSMKVASLTSLAWTPRCVPVELVINNQHVGSYLLIEQVRVSENRVNISKKDGYLIELDFHYDNEVQWRDKHGNIPFGIKYPDPDSITTAQLNYIKKYIAGAADVLYGLDFKDPERGYADWIDVDSFVDYWIVYEVMGNHELGNPGSVFFHKDGNGKLVAGPCWDFDWGVLSYNTSPHARTGFVNKNAIWYGRLFQDPVFADKVRKRFQELKPALETIPAYIDECQILLRKSAELNFAMWNPADDKSQNGGKIINGDENMTFDDAVARLRSIYKERLVIMDSKL